MRFFKQNRPKEKKEDIYAQLKRKYFSMPENEWILHDRYLCSSFFEFIDMIPEKYIKGLLLRRPIVFTESTGKYSCAFSAQNKFDIIIIFPEMKRMLLGANNTEGLAILAHEVGHLYFNHSESSKAALDCQIEADEFACKLGHSIGLQEFLMRHYEFSIDSKVRIARITQNFFTSKELQNH